MGTAASGLATSTTIDIAPETEGSTCGLPKDPDDIRYESLDGNVKVHFTDLVVCYQEQD